MTQRKLPHCPKCLHPTASVSGNYANCRTRTCAWQGRASLVIYMVAAYTKARKHDDVHAAVSA